MRAVIGREFYLAVLNCPCRGASTIKISVITLMWINNSYQYQKGWNHDKKKISTFFKVKMETYPQSKIFSTVLCDKRHYSTQTSQNSPVSEQQPIFNDILFQLGQLKQFLGNGKLQKWKISRSAHLIQLNQHG